MQRPIIQKNKNQNFLKSSRGFTLMETLIAISIFTVSVLGIMSIISQGISDTGYAKKKIIAGYLAQEGVEYIRNKRDTSVLYNPAGGQAGWAEFQSSLPSTPSDVYPITDPDFVDFTRTILVNSLSPDEINISSTVFWKQGSGDYSINFSENLFNWWQ